MRRRQPNYNDFISHHYGGGAKSVTFQVTEDCNLRCSYCYQICKSAAAMDFSVAAAFIDTLFRMDAEGSAWVNEREAYAIILEFIGGEPLLEVGLMERIIDYFYDKAIALRHRWAVHHRISLSTNGMLYFTQPVQRFIQKYRGRLSLSITLDGHKALHDACRVDACGNGSYDTVASACRHYMQHHGSLGTKITIAPENVGMLYDAFVHMVELGFTEINANCVFEDVWDDEIHPLVLYEQMIRIANYVVRGGLEDALSCSLFDTYAGEPSRMEGNWCGGTGKMLALDHMGMVYPCIRYMKSSLGEEATPIVIGDTSGVGVSPEHANTMRMLDGVTRRSQMDDECYDCEYGGGCAWCSAYNYQMTGTPDRHIKSICGMHKARVAAITYYRRLSRYANEVDKYGNTTG